MQRRKMTLFLVRDGLLFDQKYSPLIKPAMGLGSVERYTLPRGVEGEAPSPAEVENFKYCHTDINQPS